MKPENNMAWVAVALINAALAPGVWVDALETGNDLNLAVSGLALWISLYVLVRFAVRDGRK